MRLPAPKLHWGSSPMVKGALLPRSTTLPPANVVSQITFFVGKLGTPVVPVIDTLPLMTVGLDTAQPNSRQLPIRMSWAPLELKLPRTVAPTRVIDAPAPTTTFPVTVE